LLAAALLLPALAAAAQPAPEGASGFLARPAAIAAKAMVVTTHPLATAAGLRILDAGGSALDAAIAAQLVLAVVEPQSSGIGGGGFLLSFDGERIRAWDGRETAPAVADESLFLDAGGKPLAFFDAVVGGRSVGVPGLMRMLEAAQRRAGRLPWARLFADAIAAAEQGFPVSPRLHTLLQDDRYLRDDAAARALYYEADGRAKPVGTLLKNPELATTLRILAGEGATALYAGDLARAVVAAVRGHPGNPGQLAETDLARYRAIEREPLCAPFQRWQVCGMPPPSSGGLAVAQILGILARGELRPFADTRAEGTASTEAIHRFSEAGRLAFADRNRYVADPDFVPLPTGLLDDAYLDRRAALIGERSLGSASAGVPPAAAALLRRVDGDDREVPATTHLSVVDAAGHAVSLTSSIEHAFGARLMVRGFLLNNQLTDFSFAPHDAQGLVANRVAGGKRPRSSMSPTLVFERESGALEAVTGSPGGPFIIGYVARTLVDMLVGGMSPDTALARPHFGSRNGPTELEAGRFEAATVKALEARGHEVREMPMTSGLSVIRRHPQGWIGAADPRREGEASGR
jgi:gamma-glutamyltranspeptidase/glutathione hydrolase